MYVFSANTELQALHGSEYLVCDGTFEMAPSCSYQVYTIHGFVNGEGLPLVWAILPNKTADTYKELFGVVRSALISTFGDIGQMKFFVTDFERAAINAISHVFPEVTVKGCSFHFRQALMRRVQQEGLKSAYETDSELPSAVRQWIRQLMAMSMLPAFAVPLAWNALRHPPATGQPSVDYKTAAFATYFESTWVTGDFQPVLWTHFDHTGPRTTNLAEGFHNSLNSRFGIPHPSMTSFMDWLQKLQFEIHCRLLQLAAGRPPKQRAAIYVKVDGDIQAAKLQYNQNIGYVFACVFPRDDAWPMFHEHTRNYLSRVSYLIGV